MSGRRGGWCATYTGMQFWPLDPRPEDICIEDIAHALALQCRFNGHTTEFYSVAEHSVRVSRACPPAFALWGLLHDAPEAYIGDMVRPLKRGPGMEEYCRADVRIMAAVAEVFGLPMPPDGADMPRVVAAADDALLHAEARDLLLPCPDQWWSEEQAHPEPVEAWSPHDAELAFLDRFDELTQVPT